MWKIRFINNETHAVTLTNSETGDRLDLVVPDSEKGSPARKLAWLKTQSDARDVAVAASVPAPIVVTEKAKKPYLLWAIIAAEAITIALMILMRTR